MIRNKSSQQHCDDDKLIAVLSDGDQAAQHQEVVEHFEQCSRCQQRFDELAAGAQDWTKARQALMNDDPCSENRVGSAKWDYSLRNEGPVAWTDSMASQLLSPASHPELLGRIGRYDVERLIGSGGMGVVFKAHDSELNRPVAIKILAPYLSSSGPARKRFAREARAAAAVVHEHVVPIYNVETERETPFLVMHYIAGESLQGRIDREGGLELCEILRIGMQVASGLSAAHQQGLVHRDIKPSNILMEQGVERALITDFGLARAADDASLTRTGFHPGTPQYMSPEQAAGEQVDARSDLFSLGSVLYTMCTGRPPFRADTSMGVLRRITDVEPRPIREINPSVPEWLCVLISRLMSKSRDDRFANALEVADLLEQCLAHVQQPTSVPLPASLVPHAAGRRSIFNATRKGVLAMIGTIGMTLLGMVLWQATAAPDISGQWTSDEWGNVVLEAKGPGQYEGTFTGSGRDKPAPSNDPLRGPGAGSGLPGAPGAGFDPAGGYPGGAVLPGIPGDPGDPGAGSVPPGGLGDLANGLGVRSKSGPNGPTPLALDFPEKDEAISTSVKFSAFDRIDTPSGTLRLKWSRVERRFNGTWGKGAARKGTMSLRLVDKEIRGGFTTDEEVQLETGTPLVGDLLWKRSVVTVPDGGSVLLGGPKRTSEAAKSPSGLAEMKERREVLFAFLEKQFLVGATDLATVLTARDQLFQAELQLVTTKEERLTIYQQRLESMRAIEKFVKKKFDNEECSQVEMLAATAARLQAEIDLARAGETVPGIEKPLDRQNARAVVEAFAKAALAGDHETAKTLAKNLSSDHIADLANGLNVQRLAIQSVYVNDPTKPVTALATSEAVKLSKPNPDGQRDGFLLLTLTMSEAGWSVTDIDFESEESADRELKRFLEANPKAISVPPQASSKAAMKRTLDALVTVTFSGTIDNAGVGSTGIGWVVDDAGHILLPSHVASECDNETIVLRYANGARCPAKRLKTSGQLTLLQSENIATVPVISLNTKVSLANGDAVSAILNGTDIVHGSITDARKTVVFSEMAGVKISPPLRFTNIISTDIKRDAASLSGAPLLTKTGDVAGMTILLREGALLAIPVAEIRMTWEQFQSTGGNVQSRNEPVEATSLVDSTTVNPAPQQKSGMPTQLPRTETEYTMLDFIRDEAYSHVEDITSLQYAFEVKDDNGWHAQSQFFADRSRFRVNRKDVAGMLVMGKRLDPMTISSAFDGTRQQYLDSNGRLRLKNGCEGASYGIGTPHLEMYSWLRRGPGDFRWDTICDKELWKQRFAEAEYIGGMPDNGRMLEIVDFPQRLEGMKPCAYRVIFARDLRFIPIKILRRVSATTETSTTVMVTDFKSIEKGDKRFVLPTAITYTESRADGVSLKQQRTTTVAVDSLKVNEPIDEAVFTIDRKDAKEEYDVDQQEAVLGAEKVSVIEQPLDRQNTPKLPKLPDDAYAKRGVHCQKFREEDAKRPGGELMGGVLEPSKPEDRNQEPLVLGVRTASDAQWHIGGTAKVGLVVRNRTGGIGRNQPGSDVKFSYTGGLDSGLSVVAVDEAGKEHEATIAYFDGKLTFQHMLLPVAHVATIKEFTLRFDAEKRDVSDPRVAAFHLPPGKYKLRCKWNDARPDVAHEGEWTGELVNEEFAFTLAAAVADPPASELPVVTTADDADQVFRNAIKAITENYARIPKLSVTIEELSISPSVEKRETKTSVTDEISISATSAPVFVSRSIVKLNGADLTCDRSERVGDEWRWSSTISRTGDLWTFRSHGANKKRTKATNELGSYLPIDPREFGGLDHRHGLLEQMLRSKALSLSKQGDITTIEAEIKDPPDYGYDPKQRFTYALDVSRNYLPISVIRHFEDGSLNTLTEFTYHEVQPGKAWFMKSISTKYFMQEVAAKDAQSEGWHQLLLHNVVEPIQIEPMK